MQPVGLMYRRSASICNLQRCAARLNGRQGSGSNHRVQDCQERSNLQPPALVTWRGFARSAASASRCIAIASKTMAVALRGAAAQAGGKKIPQAEQITGALGQCKDQALELTAVSEDLV